MKTNVKCCAPTDAVYQAAQMMRDENVGFIPICDGERRVQGTITDRDIAVRVVAERLSGDTPCRKVMTKNAITTTGDVPVTEAIELMREHRISRMLVVDGSDCVCGVISLSDIAQEESDQHVASAFRGVTDREATVH